MRAPGGRVATPTPPEERRERRIGNRSGSYRLSTEAPTQRARPSAALKPSTSNAPAGDPIAPTEFPRVESAAENTSRPLGRTGALRHIAPRRRMPAADHAREDGYRHRRSPKCLMNSISHWPSIHRLLRRPRDLSIDGTSGGSHPDFPRRRFLRQLLGSEWASPGDSSPPGASHSPWMGSQRSLGR